MDQRRGAVCLHCGVPGEGTFCAACGAQRTQSSCRHCGGILQDGAAYCSQCGGRAETIPTHDPAIPSRGRRTPPWAGHAVLGALALLVLVWAATQSVSRPEGASSSGTAAVVPPDLSQMTPVQQFLRLADRLERAVQSGDTTTVVQFFPMLEGAFANLSDTERDPDARFHLALLRAQVGHFPGAIAQVDSIVAVAEHHLLVDYLRALIADYQGDAAAGRAARIAFRAHYGEEIAIQRVEYLAHRTLLEDFLKTTPATP